MEVVVRSTSMQPPPSDQPPPPSGRRSSRVEVVVEHRASVPPPPSSAPPPPSGRRSLPPPIPQSSSDLARLAGLSEASEERSQLDELLPRGSVAPGGAVPGGAVPGGAAGRASAIECERAFSGFMRKSITEAKQRASARRTIHPLSPSP